MQVAEIRKSIRKPNELLKRLREQADNDEKITNEPNKFCLLVSFYNGKAEVKRLLDSMEPDVYKGIDKIIFADGCYFGCERVKNNDLSTDGTRELVASYDKAVLLDTPNLLEMHKREVLTYSAKEHGCNFGIIVDSDEYFADSQVLERGVYFERDWNRFKNNAIHEARSHYKEEQNLFAIWLELGSPDYVDCVAELTGRPPVQKTKPDRPSIWQYHPRLWFRPWEVRYWLSHYTFVRRDEVERFLKLKRQFHQYVSIPAVCVVDGLRLMHDQALRTAEHLERRKNYERNIMKFEQELLPQYIRQNRDDENLVMNLDLYDLYDKAIRTKTSNYVKH